MCRLVDYVYAHIETCMHTYIHTYIQQFYVIMIYEKTLLQVDVLCSGLTYVCCAELK